MFYTLDQNVGMYRYRYRYNNDPTAQESCPRKSFFLDDGHQQRSLMTNDDMKIGRIYDHLSSSLSLSSRIKQHIQEETARKHRDIVSLLFVTILLPLLRDPFGTFLVSLKKKKELGSVCHFLVVVFGILFFDDRHFVVVLF